MNDKDRSTLEALSKLAAIPEDSIACQQAMQRVREQLIAQATQPSPDAPILAFRRSRKLVRSLKWLLPLAVAAAVVLVVGLWPVGKSKSGQVYALSDVPGLLRSAKVLHLRQWWLVPNVLDGPPGAQRRKIEAEYWLDVAGGRWRLWKTDKGLSEGVPPTAEQKDMTTRFLQRVSDGEYLMELCYDAPVFYDDPSVKKRAQFSRLSSLSRLLHVRHHYPGVTAFARDFEDYKAQYMKVGQEIVNGVAFEIWEGQQEMSRWDKTTQSRVYDGAQKLKRRVWFSPSRGSVGRIEEWKTGPTTQGEWLLDGVTDLVERDVVPPADVFDTTAPAGYTLENTKETAGRESISEDCSGARLGRLEVLYHVGFNLPDGTILLGWSSRDPSSSEPQASLFADLSPGGSLPKLPIEIHTLVPANPACDLRYTGRHLAWTQKQGNCYEWSLFVPNRIVTSGASGYVDGLDLQYKINSAPPLAAADLHKMHYSVDWLAPYASIKDAQEFQALVWGSMAELSDAGAAPAGITYDGVMQLVQQIRASMPAK